MLASFNRTQLKAVSDILGNIAVAWFSAGAISPLLIQPKSTNIYIALLAIGMTMASIFAYGSLAVVKEFNHE